MIKVVTTVMMVLIISAVSSNTIDVFAQERPTPDAHLGITIPPACPTDCEALALQATFDIDPFCEDVFFDSLCEAEFADLLAECVASSTTDLCVGGDYMSIDSTALILAGAQTNTVWLMSALAVIGSVAFGALYITSKRN